MGTNTVSPGCRRGPKQSCSYKTLKPDDSTAAVQRLAQPEQQQFLTGPQLAEKLQVDKRTVWLMARQGKIPRVLVGRAVRFELDAVLAALGGDSG